MRAYVSEKIKLKDSLSFTFILVPANFLTVWKRRDGNTPFG